MYLTDAMKKLRDLYQDADDAALEEALTLCAAGAVE